MTSHELDHFNDTRPWNEDGAQIVLVLAGPIASGKSTFAQALQDNFPEFHRCNQDDLGDRKAVERLMRTSLKHGLSVCIDRTNFDETQRSHWINIAKDFPRTRVWCIVFDTPSHICRERLQRRINHPTIRSPEHGVEVLYRFKNMFIPPSADEGLERIFTIKPEDHPSAVYSKDELQTLLVQVATSLPPKRSAPQRGIREYFDARPPHVVGTGDSWRELGPGRGRLFPSHKRGFGRYNGRGSFSGTEFRANASHNSGQSSAYNARQRNPVSTQIEERKPRRRVKNMFQDDGRSGMAAEQALHSFSEHASDRTVSLKRSGEGTTENPMLID